MNNAYVKVHGRSRIVQETTGQEIIRIIKKPASGSSLTKNGKILRLTENVSFGHDTYRVKEIDYTSGQPLTITNKPFCLLY
ncbi:MAG: hypothetical protein IPF75_09400 [Bacteroidetes bacterium]|nr:hypothetical protein [Bacteroidota bacterium]